MPNENFIGGTWAPAKSGKTDAVINPATGESIAEVPSSGPEDVDAAITAAAAAFPEWSDTTPQQRAEMLLKLADALEAHGDELGALESRNVGKPIASVGDEVWFAADNLRFFAGAARCLEGKAAGEYLQGYTSMIRRDPLGVVASIAPWNYPFMMAVWKVGPALAAGNTVVLKPSELTPLSSLLMAEWAADIFPAGVFNVICGQGESAGAPLVTDPRVALVSLTGDVATGKAIARAASDSLKRVHLELGGKAPVIVFDDADLDAVVQGVKVAGYVNAGQDCTAACRILAGPGIHDDLVAGLSDAARSLAMGDPTSTDTELGPVVSAEQRARVSGLVDRAREQGAEIVTGGKAPSGPGFYYEPSVIAGVGQTAEIIQREVFGPVVTVQRFADEAQA
ncbi:MAG TPA: aldehyde dehydrogenase family protein, partial [Acidimicrobiia bacterium]|nr:aldehyde dehydrogenase family protein [Acidimicrobiia bacterium]